MTQFFINIYTWILLNVIPLITWRKLRACFHGGVYYSLQESDHDELRRRLKPYYYIILVKHKANLSNLLVCIGTWIKTGKWGYWSHALMNLDEGKGEDGTGYQFMEAVSSGVKVSTFMEIFNCDSVCLLRPKGYTDADWALTMDGLLQQEGKPYDALFNLQQTSKDSCVEMVRDALMADKPDYAKDFADFEALMQKENILTPDMFYDCKDFEIVWEMRR